MTVKLILYGHRKLQGDSVPLTSVSYDQKQLLKRDDTSPLSVCGLMWHTPAIIY